MILRTVFCGAKDCNKKQTEKFENQGWPGWGSVNGLANERGEPETCYCCPEHLQKIKRLLNGLG
ncbi:MAG: hypothetical protein ACXAC2_17255 [Candidatus Kariarchaeaceae archaeon]|jgi:hypothetical protein